MKKDISGFLLLNKSLDLSSNQALQKIKSLFCAKKAGHTGSLDPLATGMLPICFGEATKFSQYLLNADKVYQTRIKLGVTTTTGDREGDVLEEKIPKAVSQSELESVLERFRGPIKQVPPMYSALKHQGKPLYLLAREGKEVERQPREVTIHDLRLLSHQEDELVLYVRCSKGTYIRVLAEDIGHALGCGAHVLDLYRVSVHPFSERDMLTYDAYEAMSPEEREQRILSIGQAFLGVPAVNLDESGVQRLRYGQPLVVDSKKEALVQFLDGNGAFLGVGEINAEGGVDKRRLMQ
ncbi:MAG: tRNA pseudouridine(55) synthase TruB [Gammaproteobacteria bacterium]